MSNRVGTIAAIAVGIVVVTYVGLNLVKPFKQREENLPAGAPATAQVDEVFAGDVASAPAPADAAAPTTQVAAADAAAEAPPGAHDVPDIAVPPDNQAPPKPAAEGPTAKDAPKDDAIEIEGAADFPMPEDSPAGASAPPPAPEPAPEVAAAPPAPPPARAEPPAAPMPRPTPDPVVEPSAAPPPAEPAPASADTVAAAEPAPAPEPPAAVAKPEPAAAPKAATVAKSAPRADVLSQWWPERSTPGQLNLLYAGQAANERTVGLLFDSSFAETADFASSVQLLADNGKPAQGSWELNSNRRMLLFKGLKAGRYTVVVSPQLANQAGLKIGKELHGPVYIR